LYTQSLALRGTKAVWYLMLAIARSVWNLFMRFLIGTGQLEVDVQEIKGYVGEGVWGSGESRVLEGPLHFREREGLFGEKGTRDVENQADYG